MKNNIVTALLILLLISLYFNFKSNLSSSFKKEDSISFEQKQKCATYKKDIETKFEKENNGSDIHKSFDRIFYSTKQKSCLYVYSESFFTFTLGRKWNNTMYLADALSGDQVLYVVTALENNVDVEASAKFTNLLKEYEFGVSSTSK